ARLSEGYLLSGRTRDAVECAQRSMDLARTHGERGTEGYLLRILGEIASHRDCPDAAAASRYFREAMVLADQLRMRPLVAQCHLGLGKLHRRTDQRERAREHLTTAATM